jgi:formylglycine-generating enzyme required for sulfatase activity
MNAYRQLNSRCSSVRHLVLIPEGEFLFFGTDNARIALPAFYIDKYEVTTQLHASFM